MIGTIPDMNIARIIDQAESLENTYIDLPCIVREVLKNFLNTNHSTFSHAKIEFFQLHFMY